LFSESALAATFPAVIDLDYTGTGILRLVAIFHVHIIIDKLHARKRLIHRNISCAAFVFKAKD
jgi:hypothetical protein